jgi:hypothetical protein
MLSLLASSRGVTLRSDNISNITIAVTSKSDNCSNIPKAITERSDDATNFSVAIMVTHVAKVITKQSDYYM